MMTPEKSTQPAYAEAGSLPRKVVIGKGKGEFVLELFRSREDPRVEATEHHYMNGSLTLELKHAADGQVGLEVSRIELEEHKGHVVSVSLADGHKFHGSIDVAAGKGTLEGHLCFSDTASGWEQSVVCRMAVVLNSSTGVIQLASAFLQLTVPPGDRITPTRLYYIGQTGIPASDTTNCTNEGTDGGSGGWFDIWCTGGCNQGECWVWKNSHDGLGWQRQNYQSVFTKAAGVDYMCACG